MFGIRPGCPYGLGATPESGAGGQRNLLVKALPLQVILIILYALRNCKVFLRFFTPKDRGGAWLQKVYGVGFEKSVET